MKLSEAYLKRLEDAKREGISETVANFLREGAALELAARATGLSIAEIEQIRAGLPSDG